jgi:hypothetical protein
MSDDNGFHYKGMTVLYNEMDIPLWDDKPCTPDGIRVFGKECLNGMATLHSKEALAQAVELSCKDGYTIPHIVYGYFKGPIQFSLTPYGCQFDSGMCGTICAKDWVDTETIQDYLQDLASWYNGEADTGFNVSYYWHGKLYEEFYETLEECKQHLDTLLERDKYDA